MRFNLSLTEKLWTNVFVLLNCLFVVFGFILFVIGIKAQTTLVKYNTIIRASTPAIFPTVIFCGIFSMVVACIGFVGLWKRRQLIFIIHAVGLGIVTITQLAVATASAVVHDKFGTVAGEALRAAVRYYYYRPEYQTEFDKIQTNLKCCGAMSFLDYRRIGANVPFSCRVGDLVYAEGCARALTQLIQHYILVIMSLCFIFAIIESFFLILSILLLRKSGLKDESV
ncbi:unnamed protein product [Trichobilharzia szidati]|nr:unnamed protein product [Trichobilharzia szidati]